MFVLKLEKPHDVPLCWALSSLRRPQPQSQFDANRRARQVATKTRKGSHAFGVQGRRKLLQREEQPEHHLLVVCDGARALLDGFRALPLMVIQADALPVKYVYSIRAHESEIPCMAAVLG